MMFPSTGGGDAAEFERVVHSLEFEIQQYVREIEAENQQITAIENQMESTHAETARLQASTNQLDEDTKRYHKQFTQNRDNIESMRKTMSVLSEHEHALEAQLDGLKRKGQMEREEHEQVLAHYNEVWRNYEAKYKTFPLAQKLETDKQKLRESEIQLQASKDRVTSLKQQYDALHESKGRPFIPFSSEKELIIHIAKIRVTTMKYIAKIDEYHKKCADLQKKVGEKVEERRKQELEKLRLQKEQEEREEQARQVEEQARKVQELERQKQELAKAERQQEETRMEEEQASAQTIQTQHIHPTAALQMKGVRPPVQQTVQRSCASIQQPSQTLNTLSTAQPPPRVMMPTMNSTLSPHQPAVNVPQVPNIPSVPVASAPQRPQSMSSLMISMPQLKIASPMLTTMSHQSVTPDQRPVAMPRVSVPPPVSIPRPQTENTGLYRQQLIQQQPIPHSQQQPNLVHQQQCQSQLQTHPNQRVVAVQQIPETSQGQRLHSIDEDVSLSQSLAATATSVKQYVVSTIQKAVTKQAHSSAMDPETLGPVAESENAQPRTPNRPSSSQPTHGTPNTPASLGTISPSVASPGIVPDSPQSTYHTPGQSPGRSLSDSRTNSPFDMEKHETMLKSFHKSPGYMEMGARPMFEKNNQPATENTEAEEDMVTEKSATTPFLQSHHMLLQGQNPEVFQQNSVVSSITTNTSSPSSDGNPTHTQASATFTSSSQLQNQANQQTNMFSDSPHKPNTSQSQTLNFGGSPHVPNTSTGAAFNFGGSTQLSNTSTAPAFNFDGSPQIPNTSAAPAFSLGGSPQVPNTSTAPGFSFGGSPQIPQTGETCLFGDSPQRPGQSGGFFGGESPQHPGQTGGVMSMFGSSDDGDTKTFGGGDNGMFGGSGSSGFSMGFSFDNTAGGDRNGKSGDLFSMFGNNEDSNQGDDNVDSFGGFGSFGQNSSSTDKKDSSVFSLF